MCTTLWKQNERRKHKEFKQDREETWSGLKSFLFFTFYVSEENSWLENSRYIFFVCFVWLLKSFNYQEEFFFNKQIWNMFLYRIKLKFIPMCIRKKPRPFNWTQKQQQHNTETFTNDCWSLFFLKRRNIYLSLPIDIYFILRTKTHILLGLFCCCVFATICVSI